MFSQIRLSSQNKILLISFTIFTVLYLVINFRNNNSKSQENEKKVISADTLIPRGQVLVPISLANIQALAGLIDQYGLIDLYSGEQNQSRLIANRVKILRAPLNPNQYAVLVTEELSEKIMRSHGPFWAVIQNKSLAHEPTMNQKNVKSTDHSSIEVDYQEDLTL